MFSQDIILDEEAFQKAIEEFEALEVRMKAVHESVEEMMKRLEKGFDTPAGRTYLNACEQHLLQPMKDQEVILNHIYNTLKDVKQNYKPVFSAYEDLTRSINNIR